MEESILWTANHNHVADIAKVEAKKALNEMKILELSVEIITQAIFPNSFLQLSNYRQYHAGSPMRKALANLVITRKV